MKTVTLLLFTTLLAAAISAQDLEQPSTPVAITVQGSFNFGSVDGFLQTPAGGRPGTSSRRRPTFDELGIDDVAFYDTRPDIQWHRLRLYGGYQFIRLDGSETLSQPLISHGVPFAAGDSVRSDNRLDWSRIGAGWHFDFLDRRLELMPKAELALLDFKYHLSSRSQSADRSYIKGCPRLGLEGTYHLSDIISFNVDGSASLPLSNSPQIAALRATANFRLLPHSHRVKPSLFAGVGMEWIDYEDNQTLPNHIKANIGPFLITGVAVTF